MQVAIKVFHRTPSEEYRQSYFAPLELPFMKESCSREGRCGQSYGAPLCGEKRCSRSGLIVILNKTKKLALVGEISAQVESDAFCLPMLQAVVEHLVIAVVKTLLLKFPL